MISRLVALIAVLAYPMICGMYFCADGYITEPDYRLVSSFFAEMLSFVIWIYFAVRSLNWLRDNKWHYPVGSYDLFVIAVSIIFVTTIIVNLFNADTSGLLSKGGKLDFYRENDWYRRIVTFSYIPIVASTYYSIYMLLSPTRRRGRWIYVTNLSLLFLSSLIAGSKGAAILTMAIAASFVFSARKINLAKIALVGGITSLLYIVLFLLLTSDPLVGILDVFRRFYLSIDMSILLQNRGAAMSVADRLNDVWIEVFRNTAALGVRVASSPIGTLVYEATISGPIVTGANCRFASLMLIYPARIDFLIGYPFLVYLTTTALCSILRQFRLLWFAVVGAPVFAFQAFQDVYWFTSHVAPIFLLFMFAHFVKAIAREPIHRNSNAQSP